MVPELSSDDYAATSNRSVDLLIQSFLMMAQGPSVSWLLSTVGSVILMLGSITWLDTEFDQKVPGYIT